jgi:hypothetical protein
MKRYAQQHFNKGREIVILRDYNENKVSEQRKRERPGNKKGNQ